VFLENILAEPRKYLVIFPVLIPTKNLTKTLFEVPQ
jgi:hypothetical protein